MCVQEILTDALSSPWSAAEAAILETTAGSVTVLDAVKANEADVLSGAAAARSAADAISSAAAANGIGSARTDPFQSAVGLKTAAVPRTIPF